jgi:hypothetical protein
MGNSLSDPKNLLIPFFGNFEPVISPKRRFAGMK